MSHRAAQRGFAAVAAIFLVVGLAALGAYMVTFSTTQQVTAAQDLQGTRAYWAARAGLEWGVSGANALSTCPVSPTVLVLDGFSVRVTCATQAFTEASSIVTLIQLTSTASSGTVGAVAAIERSLSASLER